MARFCNKYPTSRCRLMYRRRTALTDKGKIPVQYSQIAFTGKGIKLQVQYSQIAFTGKGKESCTE